DVQPAPELGERGVVARARRGQHLRERSAPDPLLHPGENNVGGAATVTPTSKICNGWRRGDDVCGEGPGDASSTSGRAWAAPAVRAGSVEASLGPTRPSVVAASPLGVTPPS